MLFSVQVSPETHTFLIYSSFLSLNFFFFLNLSLFLYLYIKYQSNRVASSIRACTIWWCVVSSVKCPWMSCYNSLCPLFHTHMHKLHCNNNCNKMCSSDFHLPTKVVTEIETGFSLITQYYGFGCGDKLLITWCRAEHMQAFKCSLKMIQLKCLNFNPLQLILGKMFINSLSNRHLIRIEQMARCPQRLA